MLNVTFPIPSAFMLVLFGEAARYTTPFHKTDKLVAHESGAVAGSWVVDLSPSSRLLAASSSRASSKLTAITSRC